jgi:hypothetical protein
MEHSEGKVFAYFNVWRPNSWSDEVRQTNLNDTIEKLRSNNLTFILHWTGTDENTFQIWREAEGKLGSITTCDLQVIESAFEDFTRIAVKLMITGETRDVSNYISRGDLKRIEGEQGITGS